MTGTNAGGTTPLYFSLTVGAANSPPVLATIPAQTLAVDQPYSLDLTTYASDVDGGILNWSVTGLPAGLTHSDGLISGTPTASASVTVSVTVTDTAGAQATRTFALTANVVVIAPTAITMSRTNAVYNENEPLPVTLAVLGTNGSTPLSWSITEGSLYANLDLSGNEPILRLNTMPPAGTQTIRVRVANGGGAIERAFNLSIQSVSAGWLVSASGSDVTLVNIPTVSAPLVSASGQDATVNA